MAIEILERAPEYEIIKAPVNWELERYREEKAIEELNRSIEQYISLDFSIVPIPVDKKDPPLTKWRGYKIRRASVEEIFDWCIEYGIFNIGIVTGGVSKLVVIDCDSSEQREGLKAYIPEIGQTSVYRTNRGYHYLFRSNGERIGTQHILLDKLEGGIELKGEGSYVVVPPSKVEGVKREWLVGLEHLKQIPDSLLKLLKTQQEQTQTSVWRYKGEASCISQILQRDIQKGERDIALFIVYNLLVRARNSSEYARKLVEAKNSSLKYPLSSVILAKMVDLSYPLLSPF
jgi:hypothetical protein